jgi:Zn-dependent protease with chaperone function
MDQNSVSYKVNRKEKFYFSIKLIMCIVLYPILFFGLFKLYSEGVPLQLKIFLSYGFIILIFIIMRLGLLIGYLKGNAIKINENQLPDIYEVIKRQSQLLGLKSIPDVYLMQAGGVLNAFATRFMGTNYVIIYSDILDEAYENNIQAVEFIIGHELGHVKRKHVLKKLLLFPSVIVPFLGSAYSRACEYTCDSIGASLSPKGVRNGLVLLASGKKLYQKINVERFTSQVTTEKGFWSWLSEKVSSHPKLAKRVILFSGEEYSSENRSKKPIQITTNHEAYFPKS